MWVSTAEVSVQVSALHEDSDAGRTGERRTAVDLQVAPQGVPTLECLTALGTLLTAKTTLKPPTPHGCYCYWYM